jgi:hypothetical protein
MDVPASLNTENRISIQYPIMLLSDRPQHSQGVCGTITQRMLIHKNKMSQTAKEHELLILPQPNIHF